MEDAVLQREIIAPIDIAKIELETEGNEEEKKKEPKPFK